jgi:hypothetical protein
LPLRKGGEDERLISPAPGEKREFALPCGGRFPRVQEKIFS